MISAREPMSPCGPALPGGCATWEEQTLSVTGQLTPLLECIAAAMAEEHYSPKDIFGMRLAVEEAVVNSIKHGHQEDPSMEVGVRYRIDADCAIVAVEDQGPGFNPDELPDPTDVENWEKPGGRGVFLMRTYTTWTHFNARGNCVTLCKYRSVT
ncbi:MAG TPA: ATP-binding protein [Gemmataceae bacterium]|jgi:serine/threonine-protein kinase RsbW|nr:ATP-binding protein [Gemmataceae bacterium]